MVDDDNDDDDDVDDDDFERMGERVNDVVDKDDAVL